jgi:hypothetical protein
LDKSAFWVTHCTLHFIINNALKLKPTLRVLWAIELQAMALLSEIVIVKVREERHICVY